MKLDPRWRWTAVGLLALLVVSLAATHPTRALAAPLPVPDPRPTQRTSDLYPNQMPAAGVSAPYASPHGGFLSLPYFGDRFVASIFDHCSPNYRPDGRICRFDGTVAIASNGVDPAYGGSYAMTPGQQDFLSYEGHDGWDFGLYYDEVLASADGMVTYADWANPGCHTCSFGQGVRIDHRNGFDTLYGHLWRLLVTKGQSVRRGQVIGISGRTGSVTGEHLHYGVYLHETWTPVDPYGWEGQGPDPWSHDAGNLWLGGAATPPAVTRPRAWIEAGDPGGSSDFLVKWGSAGGTSFDVRAYADAGGSIEIQRAGPWTSTWFHGSPGTTYWFQVTAHTDLGLSDSQASNPVIPGVQAVHVPSTGRR